MNDALLPLDLLLLTNEPPLAAEAEAAGVQRVLVDLERAGKAERQKGCDLFLSDHKCRDIEALRAALKRTVVMTRLDQWSFATGEQLEAVLACGAQGVMLPLVESAGDADRFVRAVNSRALVSILVETRAGLEAFAEIARVDGVDELHIGLNDLALSYGSRSIFDALAQRQLDDPAAAARGSGRRFGFGGVTDPAQSGLPMPPDWLLGEQARLGASVFWMGRSFRRRARAPGGLVAAVTRIRERLGYWRSAEPDELEQNHRRIADHLALGTATAAE